MEGLAAVPFARVPRFSSLPVCLSSTSERMLHTHRHRAPHLACPDGSPASLDAARAHAIARRLLVDGPLGAGRARMLGWLVEAADRQRQDANAAQVRQQASRQCPVPGSPATSSRAPYVVRGRMQARASRTMACCRLHPTPAQVRAKAVKCIGGAAEVDPRVLGMHEVQLGVATALQVRGQAGSWQCAALQATVP